MLLSYFKVYKSIRNRQQQIQASQSCQSTAQPTFNLAKYKKSVYTIVYILAIFLFHTHNITCRQRSILLFSAVESKIFDRK